MYTTTRHITQDYREWLMQVKHKLETEECIAAVAELKEYFDPKKHKVHVEIIARYKNFYTKQDMVSAITHDCTNFEKPIVDVFCHKDHLNIFDDKHVRRVISEKEPGNSDSFTVSFEILDR